ncbi:methylation-associated defense system protein kinase MAD6 [Flavobacterium denitrificans]|uniref:methylation-associated defense system protein kinase MAD6 n=1 Tax=Flavobacterium denitrificans TaxID=281361 RepID=UPI0003F56A54|nr:serine/threonine protein kinase [Flavobacterium denitrificans]
MASIIKPPYFESVVNAGEKRLLDYLEIHLPENYYLIPNVEIASTNPKNKRTQYWEYDLIVVAPHGIYNIENKDWKGRIEGDDHYWYLNDRQMPNPLKTGRQKTAILASKLKEANFDWGKAWIQNMLTLSFNNTYPPLISHEAQKLTFGLSKKLIDFIIDPYSIGKLDNDINSFQQAIVQFLIGQQSQKSPEQKKEIEGYQVLEIIQQEPNFTEYLVKPKGVTSVRRRIKEYALQVSGLSIEELKKREDKIKNQYHALNKLKAKPFILNVEFRIDEVNHLFYEISDFLEENSLRSEARVKTFTFKEKIDIINNVIVALKEAHKESIFHRDINPDNIYLSSGYAYLGNFGKSYFIDHSEEGYTVMPTINQNNATAYHPLELTVNDASAASDIYSLGVLVYWLFTDKEPFNTPYDLDRMGGKLKSTLLPTYINSNLPKWIDDVCIQTIITDDQKRIESVETLQDFISNAIESKSVADASPAIVPALHSYTFEEIKEGDSIGTYSIHKILGKGGYSKVFKVKHRIQGIYYALKLFNESVNFSSVKDEYNALIKLDHPNIVKFKWNDEAASGQFFTVMEYLDGENLSIYTLTDAKLPVHRVFQVGKEILSALVEMQSKEKPVLHRDIKPQNIIWDKGERFVLIDFNVASSNEANKDFVGTNPYLAPDLIADNYKINWNLSADTFAMGVTLYELICKQYPWHPSKRPMSSRQPNNPKKIEPRISEEFSSFLLKSIAADTSQRFQNAKEMFEALVNLEDKILEKSSFEIKTPVLEYNTADFNIIQYINSLYSQSRYGNFGTRVNNNAHQLDALTYTPTKLDKSLLPAIVDGQYKLLIITGNAGDGKTAFIKKIEQHSSVKEVEHFTHNNGARFKINNISYESNYDGSQDEENNINNDVLESFFQPFEYTDNYAEVPEGRIIAINEGRLVEFLTTSSKHHQLAILIEDYFYKEGHTELPEGIMVVNLNLRSVAVDDSGDGSLFKNQVKSLTHKSLWAKCEGCELAKNCFIKYNVDTLNDTAAGESVINRLEWLIRTVSLKRELHITIRDIRSLISFMLTRDISCDELPQIELLKDSNPEKYWQYYYFNITNPNLDDSGNRDRLIKLLRETDIGEVTIPHWDRELYFSRHNPKDYLQFSEREHNLLDSFNDYKSFIPAHEQTPELIQNTREKHKAYVRHHYFEGKAAWFDENDSIEENLNKPSEKDLKPSYLLRLPYKSIFDFVSILSQSTIDETTKQVISRAVSLNEGCDNESLDKENLILASTDVKDMRGKSFKMFPLEDFELIVKRTDHLIKYLEYEPDSLIFRHKTIKHIELTISLDLYEMLYFIKKGFSPSLNDLRGKFIELIVFKNLLENLNYNEIVVTPDNRLFYSIKKNNNKIAIKKLTY